jgi:hypothetical protein
MTEAIWIALIMGVPTLLASVAGGLAWVINLMTRQSKETIDTLRDERDYWRREALSCRGTPIEQEASQ